MNQINRDIEGSKLKKDILRCFLTYNSKYIPNQTKSSKTVRRDPRIAGRGNFKYSSQRRDFHCQYIAE